MAARQGFTLSDLAAADWSRFAALVLAPGIPLTHPKPHWSVPRAKEAGVDTLGYYLPPYAYSAIQILGLAIEGAKSLDQQKVADFIRANEFSTIVGKVKFGQNGEWAKSRVLQVQYRGVKGADVEQFRGPGKKIVLYPDEFKSGTMVYPYSAAQK